MSRDHDGEGWSFRGSVGLSEVTEVQQKRFEDLGLGEESLAAIRGVGYETPSPIQREFIPIAVTGRDCMGQARTGTGKTAAFVLPSLERIDSDSWEAQVLVLTPTRELSEQVAEEARRLSSHHPCGSRPVWVARRSRSRSMP